MKNRRLTLNLQKTALTLNRERKYDNLTGAVTSLLRVPGLWFSKKEEHNLRVLLDSFSKIPSDKKKNRKRKQKTSSTFFPIFFPTL